MATLKRLVIHKFRHVAPETTLNFNPERNIILGRNGTGKTTLLNLVSMAIRLDLSEIAGEDFDLEWSMLLGSVEIEIRATNLKQDRDLPKGLKNRAARNLGSTFAFSYTFEIRAIRTGEQLLRIEFDGTKPEIHMSGSLGSHKVKRAPPPTTPGDLSEALWMMLDVETAPVLNFYQDWPTIRHAIRFDEALGMYDLITRSPEDLPRSLRRIPYVDLYVEESGETGRFGIGLIPESFVDPLLSHNPSTDLIESKQGLDINLVGLPFWAGICQMLGFVGGHFLLQLVSQEPFEESTLVTYGDPSFHFTKSDQSEIKHSLLSYGQKRLLSFAYYLETVGPVVIVDELVNGFHHEWIKTSLDLCSNRQIFLTSQNPLLLDALVFENIEDVRRAFITCHIRRVPHRELMEWNNIGKKEATSMYQSMESGFETISDILCGLGLW